MAFCLPPEFAEQFKTALKSGRIDPVKTAEMTSEARRTFFEGIVGKDNAPEVNALFESKLLLRDTKTGLVNWAKKVAGLSPEARRDLISRIEKLDERILDPVNEQAFLQDLANKKLGFEVTLEEAQTITRLTQEKQRAKEAIPEDSPIGSPERIDAGTATVLLQEYIRDLKLKGDKKTILDVATDPLAAAEQTSGLFKSIVASLDNSFFGRQGIKILYTNPDIWVKNFAKSWGDIGKELKGQDAVLPIRADIVSRPNALNGKYNAMKVDLNITGEEAFPSSLPGKIPVLGRLFKASESAYNGAALRMRADYADRMIAVAERNGLNMKNGTEAQFLGNLVNHMTGRGKVTMTEGQGRFVNATVFSIRFLKSNIDTLTMNGALFTPFKGIKGELSPTQAFARRQAAKNLIKIISSVAAVNGLAYLNDPDSVEFDPRSSDFMKIKIGETRFDTTGGMGSLATLASRALPTKHGDRGGFFGGGWGFWYKSSRTGKFIDLTAGKYGQMDAWDAIVNFFEGKASPFARIILDVWKGENFDREKPTLANTAQSVTTPIIIQNYDELVSNPDAAPVLWGLILDGLGFSSYTPKK